MEQLVSKINHQRKQHDYPMTSHVPGKLKKDYTMTSHCAVIVPL